KSGKVSHERGSLPTLILNKKMIITLTAFLFLTSIITIAPLFHFQPVTGPIVNAILFISVCLLGTEYTLLIGLIPSVIALSTGLLPAILAPMIPFVMLSNAILIITFAHLRNKNYWLGIIVASVLKFIFLFTTSSVVVNLLLKKEIAAKVAGMMSWPQLVTALAGGVIAYIFLSSLKRVKNNF
ncbi:hypothetical protein KKG58_03690, partial [Patescibacteria group bacterium]|nr:hypothetical protein [Patescibacteria group bacterium]